MRESGLELPADFETELCNAVGAFEILTPFSFSFSRGPPIDVAAASRGVAWVDFGTVPSNDPTSEGLLVKAIASVLYDRCYSHRLGDPSARSENIRQEDPVFARRLAEANTGRERWDPGWTIFQLGGNGEIFVRKGDRERKAIPGTFISEAVIGAALQVGATVSLRAPRDTTVAQPGYYIAFGETLDEAADQLDLVRFYFHCDVENAPILLGMITSQLNQFQVPFQAKAPLSPSLYDRTDAIVLYVGLRYFAIAARIVDAARKTVLLTPSVPLFTKRLWPGIGVAVEPGTGESFGSHRCRLVAEGIVDAWRAGKNTSPARVAAVAARFSAAGLDLARPYLGPGWCDVFSPPSPAHLP
jgi:HopA1 effector protein family